MLTGPPLPLPGRRALSMSGSGWRRRGSRPCATSRPPELARSLPYPHPTPTTRSQETFPNLDL